jgi:hypothetical protein
MLGRLIIAVLVICSAAAVYWHRQKTEAADIGEAVAESKATEADRRAAAAEKRAKEAEDRATQAEAKAAFFEGELAKLSASADDPIAAEHALHLASVSYRGVKNGIRHVPAAHFDLALAGDAAEIARIRVFASDIEGQPIWHESWDTADKTAWPLSVLHGGVAVVEDHAPSVMTTRAGSTILALELPLQGAVVAPGISYTVEVTGGGKTTSKLLTIERRDP